MSSELLNQIRERQEVRRGTMNIVRPTPEEFKAVVCDCDVLLVLVDNVERAAAFERTSSRGAIDYTLELESQLAVLRDWKESAMTLLSRYDGIAETFGGKLGSSKLDNLERGVAALREQLFEEQSRNQLQADSIMECEAEITSLKASLSQVTQERDEARSENERLSSQLKEWQEEKDTKAGYM